MAARWLKSKRNTRKRCSNRKDIEKVNIQRANFEQHSEGLETASVALDWINFMAIGLQLDGKKFYVKDHENAAESIVANKSSIE